MLSLSQMSEDVSPSLHVWSVFDGHGQDGHHVSKFCREKFVHMWLDHDQHMPKAFKTMQVGRCSEENEE